MNFRRLALLIALLAFAIPAHAGSDSSDSNPYNSYGSNPGGSYRNGVPVDAVGSFGDTAQEMMNSRGADDSAPSLDSQVQVPRGAPEHRSQKPVRSRHHPKAHHPRPVATHQ